MKDPCEFPCIYATINAELIFWLSSNPFIDIWYSGSSERSMNERKIVKESDAFDFTRRRG